MDERGMFVAGILDAGAKAIAAGAAGRQVADSGLDGFRALAADQEARVHHLAESLAVGSPALFKRYVEWTRDAYVQRGVPLDTLDASLRYLRDEVAEALPKDARELADAQFEAVREVLEQSVPARPTPLESEGAHAELARAFLLAALEARHAEGLGLILAAADAGADVSELELDVVARVQAEVGEMWHRGEIQVAEEHMATRLASDALAVLGQRIPPPAPHARRVIVASVGGNTHDLGPRIVADHFALAGWNPIFLGSDTPTAEVVWAARELEAALVALSTSLAVHVRTAAGIVDALRAACPQVKVLVGGNPFVQLPDLWKAVGADGSARDAAEAVRVAGGLVG